MFRNFLCNYLFVCFFTGSSVSDQIIQIPTQTFYKPEDIAELKCSHSIRGYDRIFWYRQTQDQKLQLLGYMIGTSQFPEPQLGVTLAGSADEGQTSTLTIAGLWSRASSGVYYCAARHHSGGSDSPTAPKLPGEFSDLDGKTICLQRATFGLIRQKYESCKRQEEFHRHFLSSTFSFLNDSRSI